MYRGQHLQSALRVVLCGETKLSAKCLRRKRVVWRDPTTSNMLPKKARCVTFLYKFIICLYMLRSAEQGVISVLKFAVRMLRDVAKQCAKRVWKKECHVKKPRKHQLIFSWRRLNNGCKGDHTWLWLGSEWHKLIFFWTVDWLSKTC